MVPVVVFSDAFMSKVEEARLWVLDGFGVSGL
jgi:hypothetical protein